MQFLLPTLLKKILNLILVVWVKILLLDPKKIKQNSIYANCTESGSFEVFFFLKTVKGILRIKEDFLLAKYIITHQNLLG
jgi:hypothetical protein